MKTSSFIRLLLFPLLITGFVQSVNAEQLDYLSPLEKAIVHEINAARTNPKGYASFLEQWKRYYDGKLLRIPGERIIMTEEGATAVNEAINFIRSLSPVPRLSPSKGMSLGAKDHVKDQESSGSTQHKGSDRSQPWDRVNRYGTWERCIGENIAYGSDKARNIAMSLIIDDGVTSRGHRKNIFNPDFRVIGVACGHHATYRTVCVITFAGGYKEKNRK
ncbi:MAG TPA: CAP domain-containing protein [Thermodesulfobacteriota bacterium]|nr:CAP domain-containing protein [Thermodesulfobacteriota bacterium]